MIPIPQFNGLGAFHAFNIASKTRTDTSYLARKPLYAFAKLSSPRVKTAEILYASLWLTCHNYSPKHIPNLEWCQAMFFSAHMKMGTVCRAQLGGVLVSKYTRHSKILFHRQNPQDKAPPCWLLLGWVWMISVATSERWALWYLSLVDLKPNMRSSSGRLVNNLTLVQ